MSFERIQLGKDFIFTTIVQDQDGKKDSKWTVMKRDYPESLRILNKKYGLNLKILDKNKKEDKDLDWAMR